MIWILIGCLGVLIIIDLVARGRIPILRSCLFILLATALATFGPWPWLWTAMAAFEGVWLGHLITKSKRPAGPTSVGPANPGAHITIRLTTWAALCLNALAHTIIEEDPDDAEGFEEIAAVLGEQLPVHLVEQMNDEIEKRSSS